MQVKTETEKTYWLGMTENQAYDLLRIACNEGATKFTDSEKETKNNLRQTLLSAGLTKDPDK